MFSTYGSFGYAGGSAAVQAHRGVSSNVSFDTNSKDPVLMRSRVFVGNLATHKISREDIIQMFRAYGNLLGVTTFKGYAFIQYSTPTEADLSVSALNGYNWGGSVLDVKLAITNQGQVKPVVNFAAKSYTPQFNKLPGKRFTHSDTTGSTDYKRMRFDLNSTVSGKILYPQYCENKNEEQAEKNNKANKLYAIEIKECPDVIVQDEGYADTLVCGECRFVTSSIEEFIHHRANPCIFFKAEGEPIKLQCFNCTEEFQTSWLLLKHLTITHNLTLYRPKNFFEESDNNETAPEESQEHEQLSNYGAEQKMETGMETDHGASIEQWQISE